MRIAFVSSILSYPWGGADTLWTRAAEAAVARGDEVLMALSELTAAHERIKTLVAGGARVALRQPSRTSSVVRRALRRLGASSGRPESWLKALNAFSPDLVIVSCGGTYDLLGEAALRTWLWQTGTPYTLIANWQAERPELNDRDRALALAGLARARTVAFVSTRNLAVTRRHLLDPLPNARVLHNPLNWAAGSALPWPGDSVRRFATFGRLEPVKGLDLLLHAAAQALGNETGWELTLHGTGREEAYLRQIIAALGLGERVHLAGYTRDLAAAWQRHHVLVSPALDEGVPMTLPEALLAGRPVLASAVGGAEDWIEPGRSGWIVGAATVPLLAEGLRAAWAERDRWADMGHQGRARAQSSYRPDDYLALLSSERP